MKLVEASRQRTAYHEAGHAVAADELGVQFDALTILPHEWQAGSVGVEGDDCFFVPLGTDPYSPENECAFRAWAHRQAIIDYAGHAAAEVLLGAGDMSHRHAVRAGAGDDYAKASRRLSHSRARMKAAKARAVEIVSRRRAHVEKLARALLKYGRIDGHRAQVLLEDSPFLAQTVRRPARGSTAKGKR